MTTPADNQPAWDPDPRFPDDPEFYRRVLHYMPTPLLVVDTKGKLMYMNQALLSLGGWDVGPDADRNVLNFVHPDDADLLAGAFSDIVNSPGARVFGTGRSWAEIYFRIATADGDYVPIEVVGSGGVFDPTVGGVIYEVRSARNQDLLGRVLHGLSRGASIHQLLSLVAEMIASPPLDLEAAILQSTTSGDFVAVASTSAELSDIVKHGAADMPWSEPASKPTYLAPDELPSATAEQIRRAGFVDLWHLAVESPLTRDTLRIVVVARSHHVPAVGPMNRMVRSREVAAAVLLRTQSDVLLEYAAGHDHLTGLPNRAKFHQLAEAVNPMVERAALHIGVDGLKSVNYDLGQPAGDATLQIVADRIRLVCAADQATGRTAGSEFSVVLRSPEAHESVVELALELARTLLVALSENIVVAGRSIELSISIGVSVAAAGISTDHLLTWADAAMHDARRSGGGRICRYGMSAG